MLKDATAIVYNAYGQQVLTVRNISGQTIDLHRGNLPGGVYYISLIEESKVIFKDKFIIAE